MTLSGPEIHTHSGRLVDVFKLDEKDIDIKDIAHHLSNQCRFSGATSEFYSVAQHSVIVSLLVPPSDALSGLLHDASEAYLVDLPRPLKHDREFGRLYREREGEIQETIDGVFGVSREESVRAVDRRLCLLELNCLVKGATAWPFDDPLLPHEAERQFEEVFQSLWG